MFKKKVFRMMTTITFAFIGILGFGLAHADLDNVDRLVERSDDLTEHADASIEASDGIVEALDAIVEEVDAIVEDAFALKQEGEVDFANEAMEHADELIEAADGIAEGNINLVEEVYDVLFDADVKIELAIDAFPAAGGRKQGVLRKALKALESADDALEAALYAVCPGGLNYDPEEPDAAAKPYCVDGDLFPGALDLAWAADAAIEAADEAIEDAAPLNPAGDPDDPQPGTIAYADMMVEAADAAVEASDAAIEAADAAIEAADKAVEKADRLVEAAGGGS